MLIQAQTVYIVPFLGFEYDNALFNPDERDECLKPYCQLRQALQQKGFNVEVVTPETTALPDCYAILCFNVARSAHTKALLEQYQDHSFLFLWEPPTVHEHDYALENHRSFKRIYTLFDDMVDNKTYFKLFYPQPSLVVQQSPHSFDHKKLCTLIACNKSSAHPRELYSKRCTIIQYFQQHHPHSFDLYGVGWPHDLFLYKGPIANKKECLHHYKFCICYENMIHQRGYITEKIFDCFAAGCVPVYWGADNITDYIPAHCFIDRRQFNHERELVAFLEAMTAQDYNKYLTHIENFLHSPQAYYFSIDYFIKTVLDGLATLSLDQSGYLS